MSRSHHPNPFALSLSKGCPYSDSLVEEQGFDKLSLDGLEDAAGRLGEAF